MLIIANILPLIFQQLIILT